MPSVSELLANLNSRLDNYQYEPAEEQGSESLNSRVEAPVEPPESINHPGGMLEGFIKYGQALCRNVLPVLGPTLAGLATLGTLCGQKFISRSGLRTNLFCFYLGPSGSGKNANLQAVRNLLFEAEALDLLGPNTLASDAALFAILKSQPSVLIPLDEIGETMASVRRANSQRSELLGLFKEIYSAADTIYSKKYATPGSDITLAFPHLSFYATGVGNRFWPTLSRLDVQDGFIPRCLIADQDTEIVRNGQDRPLLPPEQLVNQFRLLAQQPIYYTGNLRLTPKPRIILNSKEADNLFADFDSDLVKRQNRFKNDVDGYDSLLARSAEKVIKIALIHSVSLACGRVPEQIEAESMRYAIELISFLDEHMMSKLRENLAETKLDGVQNKIISLIEKKSIVTIADVCNNLKGIRKKDIVDALDLLETSERIVQTFNGKWRKSQDEHYY